MDIWYKELGFYNNPFSIKPMAFHDEIIGYDVDLVLGKIGNGEVMLIEGNYGKGKTTILKVVSGQEEGLPYAMKIKLEKLRVHSKKNHQDKRALREVARIQSQYRKLTLHYKLPA